MNCAIPTQKTGVRTKKKIEANNCPISATCGYKSDEYQEWSFCGYFAGTKDVQPDLLVVSCRYSF